MIYLSHTPGPTLSGFINNLWLLSVPRCMRENGSFQAERSSWSSTCTRTSSASNDSVHAGACRRFSAALVSGAYQRPFVIDTREHASVIGVHFKPGGAFPFFRGAVGELADAHVDLEVLWGAGARELRERLCAAEIPPERFQILQRALMVRISRSFGHRAAVQIGLEHLMHAGASIAEIAARVELSHRRFIEVFAGAVGMRPKLFARVQRFQRAVALTKRVPSPDWGHLALRCGYFDQSHLIRDFAAFSGLSPTAFARHRGDRVKENHIAVSDEGSNSSKTSAPSVRKLGAR